MSELSFVWLEITGKCQLECVHCYASSGPSGTHGVMSPMDWCRVIDEATGLGARMVQLIGGEPTLHPAFPGLVDHALSAGLQVEVFSNLVHVTPTMWELFARPGVRLACSYYSDETAQHAAVTGRTGSHARTQANIVEAVSRSIPLRVGVIDIGHGQRAAEAMAELARLGVTQIGYDRLRGVGRGAHGRAADVDQLYGHCGRGVVAVAADGSVWPCVFSRWLPIGNVQRNPLATILAGQSAATATAELASAFADRTAACVPDMCNPPVWPFLRPRLQAVLLADWLRAMHPQRWLRPQLRVGNARSHAIDCTRAGIVGLS